MHQGQRCSGVNECVNRFPVGPGQEDAKFGMHLFPHLYMGTFDDEDVILTMVIPAIVGVLGAIWAALWYLMTKVLKFKLIGWQCGVWVPAILFCLALASIGFLQEYPLPFLSFHWSVGQIANVIHGAVLVPEAWAHGQIICPAPGSCIVGETRPQDCRCRYEGMSLSRLISPFSTGVSNADLYDATTSPNEVQFYFIHSYYTNLLAARHRYDQKGPPTAANSYHGHPRVGEDARCFLAGIKECCYGHRLEEAMNHGFCFTQADLGLTEPCTQTDRGTKLSNLPSTQGRCCSHEELYKHMFTGDRPIRMDIAAEDYSWSAIEPKEKCGQKCGHEIVGFMRCVRNPDYETVDDSFCKSTGRAKPEPPVVECSCDYRDIKNRAISRRRTDGTWPGNVRAVVVLGLVLLAIVVVVPLRAMGDKSKAHVSPPNSEASGSERGSLDGDGSERQQEMANLIRRS